MAGRLGSLVVGFRRSLGLGLGVAAALFVILSGIGTAGDRAFADLRGALMSRPMSGDLVLVQIDAASLSQVGTWPWSRRLHAALIDRLRQAHVRQVAFAIDFSAQSNPADDAALAAAMARAPGLVILPEIIDRRAGAPDHARRPIPLFDAHARVGINTSTLDSDNVTRRQPLWPVVNGTARPSMTAVMTGLRTPTATNRYLLDLRVDPRKVERLSAVDLLAGRFDPGHLRGRTIIVGGTADEISDHLLLPRVGAVPAVYALVMGYETLRAGIAITDSRQLPEMAFVFLVGGFALMTRSRRSAIAAFAAGFATLTVLPFIADAVVHVRLNVVPAAAALWMMFAVRAAASTIRLYRAGIATDAQSGLPNIVALREAAATTGFTDVGVARIDNLAEIRIVLNDADTAELMRKMCERLVLVADDLGVFHTSDGSFAWLVRPEATEELGDRFEALHAIMASPIRIGARQVDVQITCGMSTGQVGITEALRAATVAAEQAAARGLRWHAYSSTDHDEVAVRLSLIGELDGAIDLGQIFVAYQPKYDIATRTLSGAEALVRWLHPERGLIAPDHFIPLAEEHGRIAKLTHYVLDRALGDFATLGGTTHRPAVAVNLSVTLLSAPNLVEMVCDALWRHGMLPQQLTLEVTESAAMSSDDAAIAALEKLRAMGVGISIDDYGTGQSTLNYLKRLPATEIKIDQSFIRGVADSRSDAILVASTIELGHQLGMKVVAEGVETEAILRKLEAAGCDVAQGYLIARPMPFGDFARIYRDPPRVAA